MGLLARGQSFLARALGTAAGVAVVYGRKLEAVTVTAWVDGAQSYQDQPQQTPQLKLTLAERVYVVEVGDLERAGFGEPQPGDRITETFNGADVTFEASAAPGKPVWEWDDKTGRTRYRVLTKRRPA